MLGESNLKAKDYESAVMFFKKYYQLYPKGSYMELSRYNTGYALYKQTPDIPLDQSSTMEAMQEFQAFLDRYPYTPLRNQTQEMIFQLQEKLVEKECMSAQLYYNLGTYIINSMYGGSNYEACVVTAQNALRDYPYASNAKRELLSILVLRAKYQLADKSVPEKRAERFRDAIDEYYAFANDFPESKYLKEAQNLLRNAEKVVKKKNVDIEEE